MSLKVNPELTLCLKQPGITVAKVCTKCDGKCPLCDSYVRPHRIAHLCDECPSNRCIICGGSAAGLVDAMFCLECCRLERDRDGCPRIVNVGHSRLDYFYSKRQNAFNPRE